ncbi:MAG: recombinase family protein [Paraclostridium sp.]
MKKRAVGYCRISTLMQVDNTSLKDQEDKIKMYCKLHNIEIDRMFIDKAVSGKSTDRPEYDKMINYVKENEIDMIVVYKNDRLHRSLYNLLAMIYEMQEYDVALVSVTELFDTSNPQGMLFLQMLGSFAEFERAVINERTKNGRIARLNENKWVGGKPALGYKVNKHGQFEIDEEEAKIVKHIFKMRSKGISMTKIGAKYGFSKQKVDYILKNKNYIGVFEYQGKKEKNEITMEIEPIISKYMWNKINTKK